MIIGQEVLVFCPDELFVIPPAAGQVPACDVAATRYHLCLAKSPITYILCLPALNTCQQAKLSDDFARIRDIERGCRTDDAGLNDE